MPDMPSEEMSNQLSDLVRNAEFQGLAPDKQLQYYKQGMKNAMPESFGSLSPEAQDIAAKKHMASVMPGTLEKAGNVASSLAEMVPVLGGAMQGARGELRPAGSAVASALTEQEQPGGVRGALIGAGLDAAELGVLSFIATPVGSLFAKGAEKAGVAAATAAFEAGTSGEATSLALGAAAKALQSKYTERLVTDATLGELFTITRAAEEGHLPSASDLIVSPLAMAGIGLGMMGMGRALSRWGDRATNQIIARLQEVAPDERFTSLAGDGNKVMQGIMKAMPGMAKEDAGALVYDAITKTLPEAQRDVIKRAFVADPELAGTELGTHILRMQRKTLEPQFAVRTFKEGKKPTTTITMEEATGPKARQTQVLRFDDPEAAKAVAERYKMGTIHVGYVEGPESVIQAFRQDVAPPNVVQPESYNFGNLSIFDPSMPSPLGRHADFLIDETYDRAAPTFEDYMSAQFRAAGESTEPQPMTPEGTLRAPTTTVPPGLSGLSGTTVNASGESSASAEAISRNKTQKFALLDPATGKVTPLPGVDAVDARAPKGKVKISMNTDTGKVEIVEHGERVTAAGKARAAKHVEKMNGAPVAATAETGKSKAPTQPTKPVEEPSDKLATLTKNRQRYVDELEKGHPSSTRELKLREVIDRYDKDIKRTQQEMNARPPAPIVPSKTPLQEGMVVPSATGWYREDVRGGLPPQGAPQPIRGVRGDTIPAEPLPKYIPPEGSRVGDGTLANVDTVNQTAELRMPDGSAIPMRVNAKTGKLEVAFPGGKVIPYGERMSSEAYGSYINTMRTYNVRESMTQGDTTVFPGNTTRNRPSFTPSTAADQFAQVKARLDGGANMYFMQDGQLIRVTKGTNEGFYRFQPVRGGSPMNGSEVHLSKVGSWLDMNLDKRTTKELSDLYATTASKRRMKRPGVNEKGEPTRVDFQNPAIHDLRREMLREMDKRLGTKLAPPDTELSLLKAKTEDGSIQEAIDATKRC